MSSLPHLYIGTIFAIFNLFGNWPVLNDELKIEDRGSAISNIISLIIFEEISIPLLELDFRNFTIVIISCGLVLARNMLEKFSVKCSEIFPLTGIIFWAKVGPMFQK